MPVLILRYAHSENEDRTNVTFGQLRISDACVFSASFSKFSSHALTYLVHFFQAPVYFTAAAAALDMPCEPNNDNRVDAAKYGQEIPETASGNSFVFRQSVATLSLRDSRLRCTRVHHAALPFAPSASHCRSAVRSASTFPYAAITPVSL